MNPATKYDVVYIIFCLLLDASHIAFGMGLLQVSTFCTRLARITDARWKQNWSDGDTGDRG